MKLKIFIYEMLRLVYWYPVRILIQRIPITIAYKITGLFIPVYYFLAKEKCAAIVRGLTTMYEGRLTRKKINRLVRETLHGSLKTSIEKFFYPKFNKEYCDKNIEYTGLENLDKALKADKGVVLLHGHLGNPHLIMPAIGCKGYRLHQLASRNPPERLNGIFSKLINSIRYNIYELDTANKEKLPVNFIYIDRFLRSPFKYLRRNEVIAIAMDGREGIKSVELDFLKHRAIFYTGAMRLIMRTKPVVLPTFHVRSRDNTHKIIIEKPMEIEVSDKNDKDILHNIKKFVSILEEYVYKYPGQYADAFCLKEPFLLPNRKISRQRLCN
jgi:Kdo2-lipid IVA lauroyltransferase/acyltransferase